MSKFMRDANLEKGNRILLVVALGLPLQLV